MKTTGLIFIILMTVVARSFAQTDAAKYYCQGCCGGVGEYYLKLDSENEFELYYLVGTLQDNSVFGFGTYNIKDDVLTLTFENISQDGVESKKINDSDSLIIHFYAKDNVRGDSVALMNVKLRNGRSFLYPSALGTIRSKFENTETINFSAMGFNDITYSLRDPGEYELIIRLNPEGKTQLKRGHEKKFKIIKKDEVDWFEGIDDKNLKFTTKSCRR
jgi:hypothetical protein